MSLVGTWFVIIAVLWAGFFVLEGFDFGVGALHDFVAADEAGRRTAINSIGPLWDGNEVWLIVAAAGMFAAFPYWYATMFSAFYLALVILLLALILRGVSFEFRGKVHSDRWQRTWDWLLTGSSVLIPLLLGVALGDLLYGVPIDADQEFSGSFWDLLQPYALFVGITFTLVCLLHGAIFLSMKTTGDIRKRAHHLAGLLTPVTVAAALIFCGWTYTVGGGGWLALTLAIVAGLSACVVFILRGREGWRFAATSITMATMVLSIFAGLYPRVMVSSTNSKYDLTAQNTASGAYALKVMTVVVLVFFPIVLIYQGWTYYVFRQRLRTEDFAGPAHHDEAPAAASTP
jgi:cytochrome d ubiquinol oxidase subunit II